MALNAIYYAPTIGGTPQILRHPSGRSYLPNASNLVTIPVADAVTWQNGALPGGISPGIVFPNQGLDIGFNNGYPNAANPIFLWLTGATTDRPGGANVNTTTQAYPEFPRGTPFYDTTLSSFVYYIGQGQGATSWMNQSGAFV